MKKAPTASPQDDRRRKVAASVGALNTYTPM
jgi:hypothetical protein